MTRMSPEEEEAVQAELEALQREAMVRLWPICLYTPPERLYFSLVMFGYYARVILSDSTSCSDECA
jgi:hypothetical protein